MIPARLARTRRAVTATPTARPVQRQTRNVATSRAPRAATASLLDDPEVRKLVTSAKRFSAARGISIKQSPNESWESVAKRLVTASAAGAKVESDEFDPATIKKLDEIYKEQEQASKVEAAAATAKLIKLGLNPEPAPNVDDGTMGRETEYLYKLAVLNKWDLTRIRSDLTHFAEQCKTNPTWNQFYLQPSPLWDDVEYKRSIDEHLAKLPYDKSTKYFLNYLKQTNSMKSAPMIAQRFSQSLLRVSNEFTVTITTGKPLSDAELQHHAELVAKQVALTAQGPPPTIHLVNIVDQSIIGGFRLTSDGANVSADKVWDKKKLSEAIKEIADKSIGKNWKEELKAAVGGR